MVPELIGAGHEVVGLARSDASARQLEAAGTIVQRGDLDDPDGLAKAAADSDGVVHLAFQHEVAFAQGDFAAAAAADRPAVEAMGAVLAGSDRPLVLASGMLGMKPGKVSTEDDGLVPSAEARAHPPRTRRHCAVHAVVGRYWRAFRRAALPADGPWRRRPGIHRHVRRHRGVSAACRRTSVTATTAGPRCTARMLPDSRAWPSKPRPPARCSRGGRRGRRLQGHRRDNRPPSRRSHNRAGPARCRRTLRTPRDLRRP